MYKAIINKPKGRNWQQHNNSRGLNTLLTLMDRASRQKVNMEKAALSETLDQMNLIDL